MKSKLKSEIRGKTIEELKIEISKKEGEIFNTKMDTRSGKNKNTSLIKIKSDELAVLKTVLNEKQLEEKTK